MLTHLPAHELSTRFKNGDLSAVEIAKSFLSHIQNINPKINAYLEVFEDTLIQRAHALDLKRSQGKTLGPLAAVPIGIKDNILVKGETTSCGSRFLTNFKAPYHATATELLLEADAMILGKLNLDEFAMGSNTENSAFGPSKNPWDLSRTPGGSSGGSSAAVAARLCPIALGSDTGGSIRQPAAFCGIYGFKPTYGRISRYGLVAFGSSLDQIGPMAHDIKDIALCMEVLGKHCQKDSTSINHAVENYLGKERTDLQGLRIGVPHHFLEALNNETKENFYHHIQLCKEAGATIVDVELDILRHSIAVYYIIACAEAATNLARFDGVRYGVRNPQAQTLEEVYKLSKEDGFGYEVKKRILLGNFCLSSEHQDAFFIKAQKVRRLIYDHYKAAFEDCDFIATPTAPTSAYRLGSIVDPIQIYLGDIYTSPINLAGLPAISIPAGFDPQGLPLGLQLTSPWFKDLELYKASSVMSQVFGCDQKQPTFKDE